MEKSIDGDLDTRAPVPERSTTIRTGVIGLKDDHEAFDREFFVGLSPSEKMAMVPKMFEEQWLLRGGDAEQLRLRRDIARLQRRRS